VTEPTGRREQHKRVTRAALHEAAQRLFAERGYQQTTVRDIAEAAGVTERTFFRYFGAKEELVLASAGDWLGPVSAAIRARPDDEDAVTAVQRVVLATEALMRASNGPTLLSLYADRVPAEFVRADGPREMRMRLLVLETALAPAIRERLLRDGVPDDDLMIHVGGVGSDALEGIKTYLREKRPALLIIDTLIGFFHISDINDYSRVAAALEPILDLARETGTHIALVHHAKKGGAGPEGILGSTAIFGMVDTAILMKKARDGTRTVSSTQRYGVDLPETLLAFDPEIGRSDIGLRRDEHDEARVSSDILVLLQDAETPMTEPEIDNGVEGNTAVRRKALRSLVDEGRVVRIGGGVKGNPYRYQALSRAVPLTPPN